MYIFDINISQDETIKLVSGMDLDLGIVLVAPGSVTIESLLNIPSWFPVGNMIHTSAKPVSNLMWLVAFANLP